MEIENGYREDILQGVYVSGRSSVEPHLVYHCNNYYIYSLNSVWRNHRKHMSSGTERMFICNSQRHRTEYALQLPAEFSRDELGRELPFFHFKSLLLVFWLPLAWLWSTKGMQLDGDVERNYSFLSPRWGRLASARAFLALWPFPSILFSTHVLLSFFSFFMCLVFSVPCLAV